MKRNPNLIVSPSETAVERLQNASPDSLMPVAGPHSQLAEITARLTQGGSLADLYCTKGEREARRQFRQTELEHVTQVAINEIRSIAKTQMQQITLLSTQRRKALVTAENAGLGQLKREQQQLAAMEIGAIVEGDRRRKQRIDSADLLPEDRELLQLMNQVRSRNRVREVAGEHGVRFTGNPHPSAEADYDDSSNET